MRVVMIFLAAHGFLLFHLDACEMIHRPLDQTGLSPWEYKFRRIIASLILVLDEADALECSPNKDLTTRGVSLAA